MTSSSLAKSYVFYNSANYSGKTTNQIKTENIGDRGYQYTYDKVGNITAIKEKTTAGGSFNDKVSYTYDNLNQLTRENNKDLNKTLEYSYDYSGNITSVKEYAYTTGTVSSPTKTITYTYDSLWKDKLVNYNGQSITYDSIGNPLTYRDGMTFSWFGRQMESANVNGTAITYKYNADGLRTEKTVDSTVSKYEYTGDKLFYEKRGNLEFHYRYDVFGNLASITRVNADGTSFSLYTVCNSRGDIEELRRSTGELFARYVYDSWGNVLHIYDANGTEITSTANLAVQNPFRCRGYYYDNETGFYYVSSRYYDPVTHRFVNADTTDVLTVTPMGLTDKNLFAYCDNNPVTRLDNSGKIWIHIAVGAGIGGVSSFFTTLITTGNVADALISLGFGAIEGGFSAAFPSFSPLFGAVFAGIESAVIDWRKGTPVHNLIINATVATGFGALSGSIDNYFSSDSFVDGLINVHNIKKSFHATNSSKAKKEAVQAMADFRKKCIKEALLEGIELASYTALEEGTKWYGTNAYLYAIG